MLSANKNLASRTFGQPQRYRFSSLIMAPAYSAAFSNSTTAVKFVAQKGKVERLENYLGKLKQHFKTSTHDTCMKIAMGKLIPWFGHLRLSATGEKDVKLQLTKVEVTNKTLANIQSVLRKVMQDDVDDKLIETNPFHGWCYSRIDEVRERDEIDLFTKDEQAVILGILRVRGATLSSLRSGPACEHPKWSR